MNPGLVLVLVLGLTFAAYQGLRSARDHGPSRDEVVSGVTDQRLAPCPDTPNCVSSQASPVDRRHHVDPVRCEGSLRDRKTALIAVLSALPRVTIVEEKDNYIRAEFTTAMIRFIDDVEFYLPPNDPLIHIRSASRVGTGDLGANRRRYNRLARLLAECKG